MYNWVVINDNEITEYHTDVPLNWRHISNLAASAGDLEFMRTVGWFPVTTETAEFDSTVYEISRYDYIIGNTSVTARPVLTLRPPQPEYLQPPEAEKPLMDLAVLQVELQRWREALTPDANEKLAKALVAADQQLLSDIKNSIDQFFQRLAADPDLELDVSADLLRRAVTEKMDSVISEVMGHGLGRENAIALWWNQARNKAESEFVSYAQKVQGDIFSEMQKQRIMLRTALHSLNIDSLPSSASEWIRYDRDIRLIASDWSQLPDVQASMDDETKQRWARYRQALRDVPQVHETQGGFEWPEF